MHLHITGSVTLSQIFVRGVRGSTDSLVLIYFREYIIMLAICFKRCFSFGICKAHGWMLVIASNLSNMNSKSWFTASQILLLLTVINTSLESKAILSKEIMQQVHKYAVFQFDNYLDSDMARSLGIFITWYLYLRLRFSELHIKMTYNFVEILCFYWFFNWVLD